MGLEEINEEEGWFVYDHSTMVDSWKTVKIPKALVDFFQEAGFDIRDRVEDESFEFQLNIRVLDQEVEYEETKRKYATRGKEIYIPSHIRAIINHARNRRVQYRFNIPLLI